MSFSLLSLSLNEQVYAWGVLIQLQRTCRVHSLLMVKKLFKIILTLSQLFASGTRSLFTLCISCLPWSSFLGLFFQLKLFRLLTNNFFLCFSVECGLSLWWKRGIEVSFIRGRWGGERFGWTRLLDQRGFRKFGGSETWFRSCWALGMVCLRCDFCFCLNVFRVYVYIWCSMCATALFSMRMSLI